MPQRGDEFPQLFAQRIGDDARLADPAVALGLFGQPGGDALEEIAGPIAAFPDLFLGVAELVMHQQPAVRPVVVELSQGELDLAVGDVQAEVVAGDGLDLVGLVEDHHVVLRQDAHVLPPQRQVGEEQGVVDHQDLGVLHPPPGLVVEALGVHRALAAHAVAVVAGHFVPHGRQGAEIEVRQRAVGRLLGPGVQPAELLDLLVVVEEAAARLRALASRRRLR